MRTPVIYLAAALFAFAACEDPTKDKSKAVTTDVAAAPAVAAVPAVAAETGAAASKKFTFAAPDSKVEWVGSKITGKHEGSFQKVGGTIDLVSGDPEKSVVTVDIDTTSVVSDAEKLTDHMKSPDFFDVEKFPKATFQSTSIKAGGEKGASHTVTGNLDLHGVKKAISFPATIKVGADQVSVDSEFAINRKDFGIVYAGKADDLIKDDVLIRLVIRAKPN